MKKNLFKGCLTACAVAVAFATFAGNKDRTGQAGASELMINPWAQSTGLFGINTASVVGVEAMKSNVAGLAFDTSTEVGLSEGIYLTGTDITISNLGLAQKLGDIGVLGFNIMSMSFGDITETNYNNPEGIGTFHPQFINFQLAYAKRFSTHISAGIAATLVTETINNIGATGATFDAGVQYVSGKRDNFHFGVALRNVGTSMKFTGDGFAVKGLSSETTDIPAYPVTYYQSSDNFEMPTYLNFGASYDFYLDENHVATSESMPKHKLSAMLSYQSNSFLNDYIGVGAEYTFKQMFMLRAAYRYEDGINDNAASNTLFVGFSAGASIQKRLGDKGPVIALDYSFRPTQRPANGIHMIGIRFTR
jgi:Type IX secretion system membrane protein PorP/SprF